MKRTEIVEEIRQFVEDECRKPTSKYGFGPYDSHFVPMVKYAKKLALEMGADVEIVEIAGWLHDIGSIIVGREDHHVTGAEIARKKLGELGYPEERIASVANCILHHRGSQKMESETLEEQIIIEADSISCFDNITGIFRAALVNEKKTEDEARKSVLKKMTNKWNQLRFEKSKEMIGPKYEAVRILLDR
ncbi:MAG: HD domain-containing protein [Candidatus Moranbacteria bacterium]|nr:HD domain-containing protein [Candidatus Moranbacteria bacterium]